MQVGSLPGCRWQFLEIVMIVASVKMGAKPVLDIIPVVCGVLTAYALISFSAAELLQSDQL